MLAGALFFVPERAKADFERPTGLEKPACKKPAGTCIRFLYPPTSDETEVLHNRCFDVVWEDSATGRDVFLPHSCVAGTTAQNIGL
jgi:hypothetical protein